MLLVQDVEVPDEAVTLRSAAPLPTPARPSTRHAYETSGTSRVVGTAATLATAALTAAGLLITLHHVDPPPTVAAPLTVSLLPLPSEEAPKPRPVETPKAEPKAVVTPAPQTPPTPRPIVTPPPTPLAAAAPPPVAVAPAAPRAEPAPSPSPPSPVAPPSPPVAASHGPDKWEGRVLARLERFRRYPPDALHAHQQGTAYVRFRIDRDGHVLSAALDRSSGNAALDDAAMETLRRADPLPRIPPDRPDQVEIVVPIEFSISR